MKIHKEFFRYVIPSMLAFAYRESMPLPTAFLWGMRWEITPSPLSIWHIRLRRSYKPWAQGLAWAALSATPSASGTKTKNVAINFLGCPSSCLFWRAFF